MAGFFSAPNEAGVSDCTISRIGTRRSRREPSTYTLREFGIGLTAASSTRAVWAINFGLAFMALLSRTDRRGAKEQPFNASLRRHYPHQVRRVCSHPPRQVCSVRTPTLLEGTLLQAVGVGKRLNCGGALRT